MKKRITTIEFIERAKQIHGDKYDYSRVEYTNDKTKVCIICPEHGEFWQKPNNHLNGKGCKKCGIIKRCLKRSKGKDAFIKDSIAIHGVKYDYSNVEYKNNSTKVCIICPEHGEFWQTPNAHLNGQGCPECSHSSKKYELYDWIKRAKEIHGDKYDYSKVEYVNNHTKVCITCPEHGDFLQTPVAHLCGQGCPKCANKINAQKRLMGLGTFIKRAKQIHGDKYDYSKVEYINSKTKVCIICPEHGEFWQKPNKHLLGQGCPICNENKMEEKIKAFLEDNKIKYIRQYRSEWLKNDSNSFLSIDFYLPELNLAIECQGEQHFKPVEYFGGEIRFSHQLANDRTKKKLCEEHTIKVLYITEKRINTSIDLYSKNNVILIDKITIDKIKNAS